MKWGIKMTFSSKEEREKTIIKYMYITTSIAKRYAEENQTDIQELEEIGYEGLILGIDKYNESTKSYLSTYLYSYIDGYIKTNLNYIKAYHAFAPEVLQQHKEDLVYQETIITNPIEYEEWTRILKNITANLLTAKEQKVIDSYYGLNSNSPKSFNQIAEKMGYSESYINMLHKSALRKLRIRIRKNLKYFKEVKHDIDAEIGYAIKKKKKIIK